ncbi:MAG: hypothetical protein OFPII_29950 [Osedax symbiont Rs1]|nr:MAG: hypothetical protein OFPII_29950 [Osedax symbiont Rs1]
MSTSLIETELNTIIEKSCDTILITDSKGVILNASPNFFSTYGYDYDKVIGVSVYQLEEEKVLYPSVTSLVIKYQKEMQIMQTTLAGHSIFTKAIPIFDSSHKLIKVISFSDDFTNMKLIRDEYEKLQKKVFKKNIKKKMSSEEERYGIKFISKTIEDIFELLQRISAFDTNILLLGESGSGKTLFASKIHAMSCRKSKPFIEVSCGAIPDNLFESEFFGYEAGAFTGAQQQGKPGLIEQADQGTLFLDEVSELPLLIQTKLLKVLQDKRLTRIGGTREKQIDFRLITATNKSLDELVQKGEFRLDLYYRINVIPVYIPALRDHREDIPILIQHFLEQLNQRYQQKKQLDPIVEKQLIHYQWPGNIRELKNVLERLYVTCKADILSLDHQIQEIKFTPGVNKEDQDPNELVDYSVLLLPEALALLEKNMMTKAKETCNSTYAMSRYLGISQPSVVRKLQKHKL